MGQRRNLKRKFKIFQTKWKYNSISLNLCNEVKTGEKFIALNSYSRNEESSKINNLSFYLRKLEKEQLKSKVEENNK